MATATVYMDISTLARHDRPVSAVAMVVREISLHIA